MARGGETELRAVRLTGPQQGYLALAVFVAFAILPLRAFVALMILLGGAVLTRPDKSAFPRDEAFRYLEGMIKAAHERMDEDEAAALQRKPGVFGRFMKRITEKAQFAVLRSMMRVRVLDYGVLKLALVSVADGTDAPEDDDSAIVYLGLFGHWINGDLLVRTVMRNVGMPLDDDAGPART